MSSRISKLSSLSSSPHELMTTRIPPSYAIRQLKPADAPLFRTLRLEALATSPDSFGSNVSREEAFPMEVWEERSARTAFAFELVTLPGSAPGDKSTLHERAAGMIAYHWTEQGEALLAHLVGLWVHPAHRGKGLGSALVEWVVEQVFPSGAVGAEKGRRLQLEVGERNKEVISIYERLGFRRLETNRLAMEYYH
ncbi:hypothetical protein FS837_008837 [Tulasnella sp. UAMH 9824]|nr:hypothetical protein FS837_008837 [Tulasnella sp. UAMH 9824]